MYIVSPLRHAFFSLLKLLLQVLEKRTDLGLDNRQLLLGFLLFDTIDSVVDPFRFFLFEIEVYF